MKRQYTKQTHTGSHRAHTAGSPASLPASCPACVPARWAAAGLACTRADNRGWPECRAWGRRCTWPPRLCLWRDALDILAKDEEVFTRMCQIKYFSWRKPESELFVFSSSTETHMGFLPWRPVLMILTAFFFFCWLSRQSWPVRKTWGLLPGTRKKLLHDLRRWTLFLFFPSFLPFQTS